jgi:hypothetical protein
MLWGDWRLLGLTIAVWAVVAYGNVVVHTRRKREDDETQ